MSEHAQLGQASARAEGLAVRAQVISLLTGQAFSAALASLLNGGNCFALDAVSPAVTDPILGDLERDDGWNREHWVLDALGNVSAVGRAAFEAAPATLRFSDNACLRKPSLSSFALRGFLSAVTSDEVRVALSDLAGAALRFRSADIAQYRQGDYLRRHQDVFDGRRFGLVWFFSRDWTPGSGGELVVEAPDGAATVIAPRGGTVGGILFAKSCHHQVAAVRRADWDRYSIATHFADASA